MRQIRILHKEHEFIDAFMLRYKVYSHCDMDMFLRQNQAKLDMDFFDMRAFHLGLFEDSKLIGTQRLVVDTGTHFNEKVFQIGAKKFNWTKLQAKLSLSKSFFPMLQHQGFPKKCAADLRESRHMIVEGSRLAILPKYRSLRNSRDFFEAIVALTAIHFDYQTGLAILCCNPSHESFYSRYGFRRHLQTKSWLAKNKLEGLLLSLSLDISRMGIPTYGKERILSHISSLTNHKRIILN